jgi:hypothetical protein
VVLPRKYRTVGGSGGVEEPKEEWSLLTKEAVRSYTSNWSLIHYKYSAYSGSYLDLPKYISIYYQTLLLKNRECKR